MRKHFFCSYTFPNMWLLFSWFFKKDLCIRAKRKETRYVCCSVSGTRLININKGYAVIPALLFVTLKCGQAIVFTESLVHI